MHHGTLDPRCLYGAGRAENNGIMQVCNEQKPGDVHRGAGGEGTAMPTCSMTASSCWAAAETDRHHHSCWTSWQTTPGYVTCTSAGLSLSPVAGVDEATRSLQKSRALITKRMTMRCAPY